MRSREGDGPDNAVPLAHLRTEQQVSTGDHSQQPLSPVDDEFMPRSQDSSLKRRSMSSRGS